MHHRGRSSGNGLIQNTTLKRVLIVVLRPVNNLPQEAAKPQFVAATADGVRGGDYFGPQGFLEFIR
jgi:hypothetical protein